MNVFTFWPPAQYQVLKNWMMHTCTQMGCIPQDRGAIACGFGGDMALEHSFALQGAQTWWFISLKIFNSKSCIFFKFFYHYQLVCQRHTFSSYTYKSHTKNQKLFLNLFPNQQILETLICETLSRTYQQTTKLTPQSCFNTKKNNAPHISVVLWNISIILSNQ